MIHYTTGNILTEDVEALVNPVNCVGVMGKGLALAFKNAFPKNFAAYEKACRKGKVKPGKMFVFPIRSDRGPQYIINFPTKKHWRNPSRIEWVEEGLKDLRTVILTNAIRSVAIPPIGCGLGGLEWKKVRPLIEDTFKGHRALDVVVFEPLEHARRNSGSRRNR